MTFLALVIRPQQNIEKETQGGREEKEREKERDR